MNSTVYLIGNRIESRCQTSPSESLSACHEAVGQWLKTKRETQFIYWPHDFLQNALAWKLSSSISDCLGTSGYLCLLPPFCELKTQICKLRGSNTPWSSNQKALPLKQAFNQVTFLHEVP